MPGKPGPDGRHDDLEADELQGLALLVPDDARSLDADRDAYLTELRDARDRKSRRRTDAPATGQGADQPPRWRRIAFGGVGGMGLAGPALLVLLVVLGLVGSTLSVFGSGSAANLTLAPLATPTTANGQVGGLLPDIQVNVNGTSYPLRYARPAILVLVPAPPCVPCADIVTSLRNQAQEYGLQFALIGPPSQQAQLVTMDADQLGAGVPIAVDKYDAVASAYQPVGVTALLVKANGIVAEVARDVSATTRLETALSQLVPPSPA